jgi:hypothetical protein
VWLTGTAAILHLLTATGHLLTRRQNSFPAILPLHAPQTFRRILIDQKLSALDAHTAKHLQNHLEELDVIDWAGQRKMAEVTRASMIIESTRAAEFSILQNTHAGIGEATDLPFLSAVTRDFYDRASYNLIRTEDTKLDANNRLRL